MSSAAFVAFDLGAESGRAMLASFDGERFALRQVLRFRNVPLRAGETLRWNVRQLFDDIKRGLVEVALNQGKTIAAIGIDTWGVDFALLGRDDELLGNPFHYRDVRTLGMMERVFERVPREQVFEQTGIQFLEINSLYQLYAMRLYKDAALEQAHTFLMMPDLFNFWLTGSKACEFTDVTTTQCYDPRKGDWARPLLNALEIPTQMFPTIIPPGTRLGGLRANLVKELGIDAQLVAPASHDTGSAIAAVPLGANDAWISSGTWSIVGAEVPAPVINAASRTYNFTNEGGVNNTFRLSKNVMGLWLVQECRRIWAERGQEHSYAEMVELAERAPAFRSLIDPDDDLFFRPGDMPARMVEFCERSTQPVPTDPGMFVRCALESLALKYRFQLERLEALCGKRFDTLHIAGGGTQNRLLCQFTANATSKRVLAGLSEATTLGNVVMQMLALGYINSLAQGREVVRKSFPVVEYSPQQAASWDDAYGKFITLLSI